MDLSKILELRENNPYSIGQVLQMETNEYFLERRPLTYVKSQRDRYYTVEESEDLWMIANEAYGDSKLYWVIQDCNEILCAFHIEAGDNLIIPDLVSLKAAQDENI